MADTTAPEFERFVKAQRSAKRIADAPHAMAAGDVAHAVFVEDAKTSELLRVSARRAAGLFRPTEHTEAVWVNGANELAINLTDLHMKSLDGLVIVGIPVRCDQVGDALVEVGFAVGSPDQPAGMFAATYNRPNGPPLIIDVWGDSLVAFAWECLLGMVTDIAGAVGKDARGNVLVPVEVNASRKGLQIVPMARHRFTGSSGLTVPVAPIASAGGQQ